jgi:hypothetical protein
MITAPDVAGQVADRLDRTDDLDRLRAANASRWAALYEVTRDALRAFSVAVLDFAGRTDEQATSEREPCSIFPSI